MRCTPTDDLERALEAYQESRRIEVLKLQSAARNSTEWFEAVPRYVGFEPMQFAYALLTRSQRVSHENLRLRDRTWLEGMEQWFAERASRRPVQIAVPPMFTPFRLRELELANRIAVSPMAMYSAEDGVAGDFHLVHLGTRAQGGAGLVFTEMTCVGAGGAHHARLRRHVQGRARRRLDAHRRLRAPAHRGEDLPAARPRRARRARPSSAGRAWTSRWTRATGS